MKCAIMQPSYLPWAGFFNLISMVDTFIFLDDAQFQKGSWHNRNQISNNGLRQWITVPIRHERLDQKINQTFLMNSAWKLKHIRTIEQNYHRHDHADDMAEIVEFLRVDQSNNLADLNIGIIRFVAEKLSLATIFLRSSEIGIEGKRTSRLVEILKHCGATTYLSPVGAKQYLEEDSFERVSEIKLQFQDFKSINYPQRRSENFQSHLSVIDLIANVGFQEAFLYISDQSGVAHGSQDQVCS
jgi:hypothetical protein